MKKPFKIVLFCLVLMSIGSYAFAGQYSAAFQPYLADHSSQPMVGAIITMADQVDLNALQAELTARQADRREWHEVVVRALQAKATETQGDIMAQLADLANQGKVEKFQGLWVANIVLVTATPEVLDILVQRNDVLQVSPDYEISNTEPVSHGQDEPSIAGVENGLRAINAPQAWAMGFTGEGRLVSHLDTGVDGNHPALNARWRGYDSRYDGHADWAWFDPVTFTDFPFDSGQHGTHTMGTICGLGVNTGDTIGVAFGAQWMSAGVIDRGGIGPTVTNALLSFQWIVDPDGNPATVWDVPDVNSNSWGVTTGHGYPDCDETFWAVLDGAEAAGIVVVFAAGNEGPGPTSLRRPADRATTDITSFAIAAVDGNNQSLPIADFSSRGPTYCTPNGDAAIKPEVSAPGVNVRSSVPGGQYQGGWSGTSMATPHVAGVVALMRQANPNLTSAQVREILLDTATDLGPQGNDNSYGMGIVNAYAAVQRALSLLHGWGVLAGTVTDQASGLPLQGAMVSVVGRPWSASSRANGSYSLYMPADTLWNIRVEFPPTHLPVFDQKMVAENETTFANYALEGKVTVTLKAQFGNPVDASYRTFYLKGSWNNDGFYDAGWSGDLLAIKDDGVSPDQAANDGIFTGNVLLARDLTHTYQWAIYSENYNGEAPRLDDGAGFQILNLNPPTVPTLSVNPSGSYNNWIISAVGDHGLNLDLARGVNNRPTKWGAATPLIANTMYTFKFTVMHSNVGWYGIGGVGGANITFTPTVDGSYDFVFDDRDDTFIIQLAGTEGPQTYLHATGGLDHHVPLTWLAPGMTESREIAYDDGALVNAYYYYAYDALMAEMFEINGAATIDSVMIHVLTEGDPYWPWPDASPDPIGVSVYLDDGSGNPQADAAFYTEVTGELGQWVKVDVPEVEATDRFWVAMNNIAGGGEEGIGLDATTDYPGNKWSRMGGVWGLESNYDGDHMIRAKVFGGARSNGWLSFDSGPKRTVPANLGVNNNRANTHAVVASGNSSASKIIDRTAHYPKIMLSSDPPIITDVAVLLGYNLYRDVATGPYDRHLPKINGSIITATAYDDWGDDLPNGLTNGTLYYYQGSAVYDIGGGQNVEIGPSNQATATPINASPEAPTNLVANVVGRNVNLTWNFNNANRDFAHFSVERKLMPYGAWGQIATTTVMAYVDVIGQGQDGTYGYRVIAVDDGTPPLSSEPSNTAYGLVGHLPPSGLIAVSGEEFAVPLRWMLPGSWRGASSGSTPSRPVRHQAPLDLSKKGINGPINPPVIADQGGPDAFGYTWIDSDEPGGPAYAWVDITDNGTPIPLNADDQSVGPMDIGFDFPFYGNMFSQFNVCSNGFLSFTSNGTDYVNGPLPNPSAPENMIAAFWDDLNAGDGGSFYYYSDGSELVISYIGINHFGGGGPYTFQWILRATGTIILQYENLGVPTNSCTVGIQNGDGSIGLQVVADADYLHSEMAIRIGTGPEGFAPAHYNLYRALSSPVPLDNAHLITSGIPGADTRYTDHAGIVNGTTYYYAMTATWSDSVASPASNEANATPANHSPEPPADLAAVVNGRNVNLTWTFTNQMGDFNHYNIWKKLVPGGSYVLAGTSTSPAATINIPVGQDGTYGIVVTAVDNGNPAMESAYSNQVFVSVGNLPPTNLRATNDQEGCVPLHWAAPGMRPTRTIVYDDGVLVNAYYYYAYDAIIANSFSANSPIEIDTLWIHTLTEGDAYWPWPDGTADPIGVSVFDDDGSGQPGDMVYYAEVTGEIGQTIMAPIEGGLIVNGPNFWVGFQNIAGGGEEGIGLDAFTDFPENKWAFVGGIWGQQDTYSGDQMIRVTIVDNGRSLTLSEKAPTPELARKTTLPINEKATSVVVPLSSKTAPMLTMSNSGGDNPRPLDTEELLGYNVYRQTTPNVVITPANKINSSYVLGNAYNDSAVVNGTTYYYKVTAVYNNPPVEESPGSNEVSGTPRLGGRMILNPTSFDVGGGVGQIVTRPLNISNPGGLAINYSIVANTNRVRNARDWSPTWSFQAVPHSNNTTYDKSQDQSQPTHPPMTLGRGGPDSFGYLWIDSDEPGGPTYNWIDIQNEGTPIGLSGDDQSMGPMDIGFEFPYYGSTFSQFYACSNGWISFTNNGTVYFNGPLPDPSAPENMLAPFWDDLNFSAGGESYYYTDGSQLVISYINVPHYSSGGPYSFQIVLSSSGAITFNYMDIGYPDDSNTIGIQNGDGSIGLQVAYDQTYVHSELAVRFTAGWLAADPASGTVNYGQNTNSTISFDASFLEIGTYNGSLLVTGTDANHQVAQITVPVIFRVGPTGIDDKPTMLPTEFALSQNYPNPFNPSTEIRFALPTNSAVTLEIFNVLGQKVKTLANGPMNAGYQSIIWNGTDETGSGVASGMYFYKLNAGGKTFTKKMMMLK